MKSPIPIEEIDLRDQPEVGKGKGVGLPRQSKGGFSECICPQCRYTVKHERGIPCNKMTCPKCNRPLIGKKE